MNLNDEQRAALARFLGFREIALVSKRFAPSHRYLIDRDGTLEGEAQWNDADLMLALLDAASIGQQLTLAAVISHEAWAAATEKRKPDFAGAVIRVVAGWPESQGGGV